MPIISPRVFSIAAIAAALASPALAHHPLAGQPMTTFTHGLLSGVGHPLLGFDHLFFIIAVGVAAVYTGRALLAPLFFIAGMLGGVMLILNGVELPMVETVIALSLLGLGGLVMAGSALSLPLAALIFAGLGLFHGWAFGESLAGQEGGAAMSVTIGYLLGLAATQWLVAVLAGFSVSKLWSATRASDMAARLTGAVVVGVGAFLTLELIEGAMFEAIL